MRESIRRGVTMLLIAGAVLPGVRAVAQEPSTTGSINGAVKWTDSKPLSEASVRIRRLGTGQVVATTNSGRAGEFSFAGLDTGSYVIDVIDRTGKIVGMSAPVVLTPGAAPSVSIVAVAGGVLSASSAGFSLLGLGPVTSMAVLGAAGAAAVTAVVATTPDASPSR